jgi:hypothetical protein
VGNVKCGGVTGFGRVIFHLELDQPVDMRSQNNILVMVVQVQVRTTYWWHQLMDTLTRPEVEGVVLRSLVGINKQGREGLIWII